QHLLASLEPILNRGGQLAADHDIGPLVRVFSSHVYEPDGSKGSVANPTFEPYPDVLPRRGMLITLHRRRRRPENDEGAFRTRQPKGDVPAVISRRLFLLVRAVVLFVDNHKAEPIDGSEHR